MMKSITEKINEELKKIQELPPLPNIKDQDNNTILLSETDGDGLWNNMSDHSYKFDDLIIQPLNLANLTPLLNTVSLSGTGAQSTYSIGASGSAGAGQFQSSLYNTAVPSYSWNTLNPANKVNIHSGGIELDADADITIGGRSMKKLLEGIEQRLAILVPDPNKLERYEALRQAYEHYKTLEALCVDEPETYD